jgi:hypothetical protein
MSTPRSITDLQILGSNLHRGSRRRGPGAGGRPLKNRSRALPRLELLEDRMLLTNFSVNSNADTNTGTSATTGTLRYVLNQLDSTVGGSSNVISFASLPAADFTFTPGSALPTITRQVTIEGNIALFSGAPLIQISGGSAGSFVSGLVLGSGSTGSVIESLVINHFGEDGIDIYSSNDRVIGSYVGTNVTGGSVEANSGLGILVDGPGATIGGTSTGSANIISGNGSDGVEMFAGGSSCLVEGNRIGTNQAGTASVANGRLGIEVESPGATIGGTSTGSANIISGNFAGGGLIEASSCLVEGNLIGTNAAGTAAVANGLGIGIEAPGATIGGTSSSAANIISGNTGSGVDIAGSSCLVEGNLIGTNATGTAAVANAYDGINVIAAEATIGGTSSGDANIISGNANDGVGTTVAGSNCLVEGNRIGTNRAGTASVANGRLGIEVESPGATIGGTSTGSANIISGNFAGGGLIEASSCLVEGNLIGTNAAGTAAVANGLGIGIEAPGATIGGTSSSAANIISGNTGSGVDIAGSSCLVEGNLIGTNATGTAAVANAYDGINVIAADATIGGTSSGDANIISGNANDGVGMTVDGSNCLVEGNRIGTNQAGTASVGNTFDGIYGVASGATIGGISAGDANVISGNSGVGVVIGGSNWLVEGNLIGTNATGTTAVANGVDGILVGAPGATIGGTSTGDANIISGNAYHGIVIDAPCRVEGNLIGTNATGTTALGNTFDGIAVIDSGATIGGTSAGGGNIIAFNGGPGVATVPGVTGTTIRYNAIYSNVGPGIDRNDDGVTPNTPNGANNTPVLTLVAGGIISGTLNASPNSSYVVDLYANFTSDASPKRPQGRDYLTSTAVMTNAAGDAVFNVSYTPFPGLPIFTAAATNGAGTTSEFSPPLEYAPLLTPVSQSPVFVAGTLESCVVASFVDASPQAFPGQFTATINWGDNTGTSPGVVSADGTGFDVTGSHTYNFSTTSTANEPVTVTIADARTGAAVAASSTATVNPAPITIQTTNFAVKGGVLFSGKIAAFTDSDPRIDPTFYTATINWGDGSPNSTGVITGTNPFTVTSSHTFAPFQHIDLVTITITDKNGRTATGVDRVVDPPAVLEIEAGGLTLSPSKPFVGTVATFTDSGPAEPASDYQATINWGKGRKAAGMITGSNGRFVVSGKHMFSRFSGSKPVSVTVTDITDGRTVSVHEFASYVVRLPRASLRPHILSPAVSGYRDRLALPS